MDFVSKADNLTPKTSSDIPVLDYPFIRHLAGNLWQICFVDSEHKKRCISLLAKKYPEIYKKHQVKLNLYPKARVINYLAQMLPKKDLEVLVRCYQETLPEKFHHIPGLAKAKSISDLSPQEVSTYFQNLTPAQRGVYTKSFFGKVSSYKPSKAEKLLKKMYEHSFIAQSGEDKAGFLKRSRETLGRQGLIKYYDLVSASDRQKSGIWKLVSKPVYLKELKRLRLAKVIPQQEGETKHKFLVRCREVIGRKILQSDYLLDKLGDQLALVRTKGFTKADLALAKSNFYVSREICDDRTRLALELKQVQDDPRILVQGLLEKAGKYFDGPTAKVFQSASKKVKKLPNPNIWYGAASGIKGGLDNLADRSKNQSIANALTVGGEAVQFFGYDIWTPLSYPSFFVPLSTLDRELKQAGKIMNTSDPREANKIATQHLFYGGLITYGAGRGLMRRPIPVNLKGVSFLDTLARAREAVDKVAQTAGDEFKQTILPPPTAEAIDPSGVRIRMPLPKDKVSSADVNLAKGAPRDSRSFWDRIRQGVSPASYIKQNLRIVLEKADIKISERNLEGLVFEANRGSWGILFNSLDAILKWTWEEKARFCEEFLNQNKEKTFIDSKDLAKVEERAQKIIREAQRRKTFLEIAQKVEIELSDSDLNLLKTKGWKGLFESINKKHGLRKIADFYKRLLDTDSKRKFSHLTPQDISEIKTVVTRLVIDNVMKRKGLYCHLGELKDSTPIELACGLRDWMAFKFKELGIPLDLLKDVVGELEHVDSALASKFRSTLAGQPIRKILLGCEFNDMRSPTAQLVLLELLKNKYKARASEFKVESAGIRAEETGENFSTIDWPERGIRFRHPKTRLTPEMIKEADVIFVVPEVYERAVKLTPESQHKIIPVGLGDLSVPEIVAKNEGKIIMDFLAGRERIRWMFED